MDAFILSRDVFENLRARDPQLVHTLQTMAQKQSQRNQALLLAGIRPPLATYRKSIENALQEARGV